MVASRWGLWLGAFTAIASAVALGFFHLPPVGVVFTFDVQYWLILPLFLVVALLVGVVAEAARSRAIAAEQAAERARLLAEKQAALRRVAMLAVRGAPATEIFNAVAGEIGGVLATRYVQLGRFEPDETMTVVGGWSSEAHTQNLLPIGSRWDMSAGSLAEVVWRIQQPTRLDIPEGDDLATLPTDPAIVSAVGCPISVEGRVWGLIASAGPDPQPTTTEARITEFTELLATALADAENRTRLAETQARVVSAVDLTHRRLERDMHERVQKHLYTLAFHLGAAQSTPGEPGKLRERLSEIDQDVVSMVAELRRMFLGLPSQIRSEEGNLVTAIRTLVRHCTLPVELSTRVERPLPAPIETAVYNVVSAALSNATHDHALAVYVDLEADETELRLSVRDDGIGGATFDAGSDLVDLRDRIEALGGHFEVTSPKGKGTSLLITVPVSEQAEAGQARRGP